MTQSPFASAPPRDVRQAHPAHRRTSRRVANLAFTLVAWLGAAPLAAQQPGTVSGTVLVEGTQRPVTGATVAVEGQTGVGATTDASGKFRITGLTGTTVTLSARALGYRPETQTVNVGSTTV